MNVLLTSANARSATQERLIYEVPEFDLPKILHESLVIEEDCEITTEFSL
jgi:hypothetical protein